MVRLGFICSIIALVVYESVPSDELIMGFYYVAFTGLNIGPHLVLLFQADQVVLHMNMLLDLNRISGKLRY